MYLQIFLSQIPQFGSWEERLEQYVERHGNRFQDAKLVRASFLSSDEPTRTYEPNFKKLLPEERFYALKASSLIVGTITYGFCMLAWLGMAAFKGIPIHDQTFVWTLALIASGSSLLMSFFLFCSYKSRHIQLLLVKESKEFLVELKATARRIAPVNQTPNQPSVLNNPAYLRSMFETRTVSSPPQAPQKQTKKRKKKIVEEEEQPKRIGRFDIL